MLFRVDHTKYTDEMSVVALLEYYRVKYRNSHQLRSHPAGLKCYNENERIGKELAAKLKQINPNSPILANSSISAELPIIGQYEIACQMLAAANVEMEAIVKVVPYERA